MTYVVVANAEQGAVTVNLPVGSGGSATPLFAASRYAPLGYGGGHLTGTLAPYQVAVYAIH